MLVPMLYRAHRVEPLLASITAATPSARVLFLTTPEDLPVRDAIDQAGADRLDVDWQDTGDFARKTNAGYRATTEPLLFLGADDLHFHPGWYETCLMLLDPGIGVIGTNDLTNRRTAHGHSTHSLVTRDYANLGTIDGPGILHEGYPHELVDDELVETAQFRGAYRHAPDAFVEHLHPMGGKAPMDPSYALQSERIAAGRPLYTERRKLWT